MGVPGIGVVVRIRPDVRNGEWLYALAGPGVHRLSRGAGRDRHPVKPEQIAEPGRRSRPADPYPHLLTVGNGLDIRLRRVDDPPGS